jgi:hypothetical protein
MTLSVDLLSGFSGKSISVGDMCVNLVYVYLRCKLTRDPESPDDLATYLQFVP